MRKVYLENLPMKPHNNTTVIDWKELNGHTVKFEHDGKSDIIEMYYSYTKRYVHYIKCIYKGKEKTYPVQVVQNGTIGSLVNPHPNQSKPTEENWLYQRTDLHRFVDDPEDLKNYHKSANKDYDFRCPSCGKVLTKKINTVTKEDRGISCDVCPSSHSKNERLVSIVLTKIKMKYETQKCFKECKIKKMLPFDFYIPSLNMVIETHGSQHYEESGLFDHEGAVKSDRIKREFCKNNGIKYCEIDCSSEKSSETIRQLKNVINITLSEEELKECMYESMHNISEIDLETASNLYNCFWNFREIGEYLNVAPTRIKTILEDSGFDIRKNNYAFNKSLINLITGEVYGNETDFVNKEGFSNARTPIRNIIKGKSVKNKSGELLYIVHRKTLQIGKDKSHLKRVYNEAIKQLNENKVDRFEGLVGKDIEELINNSTNQKQLMLLLDNLPKEYYIQNGIVYKN